MTTEDTDTIESFEHPIVAMLSRLMIRRDDGGLELHEVAAEVLELELAQREGTEDHLPALSALAHAAFALETKLGALTAAALVMRIVRSAIPDDEVDERGKFQRFTDERHGPVDMTPAPGSTKVADAFPQVPRRIRG